jgi:hypothetical protein
MIQYHFTLLYLFCRAIFCNKKIHVQLSNDMTPHNERRRIMIQVSMLFWKKSFQLSLLSPFLCDGKKKLVVLWYGCVAVVVFNLILKFYLTNLYEILIQWSFAQNNRLDWFMDSSPCLFTSKQEVKVSKSVDLLQS